MASYKVIQDIEAEDKLIWNLSIRQFIYAFIAVTALYVSFTLYKHGAWILDLLTMPFVLFFSFLAFPFMRDQPTEVWALAKLRFILKPKIRIWDQNGANDLVTVTAPKKIQQILTNRLSQTEVNSRLETLAETLDSRGWSMKNASNLNKFSSPLETTGDRLINLNILQGYPAESEIHDFEDILDDSNPDLKNFQKMVDSSTRLRKESLMNNLEPVNNSISQPTSITVPVPIDNNSAEFVNMRTLRPLKELDAISSNPNQSEFKPSPDIINLSQNNVNSVSTISKEVNNIISEPKVQENNGEVIISLR
ncbi:MAG: PrgI family protein [bacterium]|jgi:hypothetical protein